MPSRKKKSEAWKKLRSAVRKGPKRVRIGRPRRNKESDPLLEPKNHKKVQISIESGFEKGTLIVFMFTDAFKKLNLIQGQKYTMAHDKLTRAGKCLKSIFKYARINDYIRKHSEEKRLPNFVGRCIIFYGARLENADAYIHITHNAKELEQLEKTKKYVRELFDRYSYS